MNRTAGYLDDRHPALQYDVRVRLREAATARRVPVRSCVRLRRAFDATRSCAELERNVPFYQTNPPILSWKTAVIQQCSKGLHNKIVLENGGFVLENEPPGTGILVGFGCREHYIAASRRTRFGKRTHRSAFARPLRRDSSDSEGVLRPWKRHFGENEPKLICSESDMYSFELKGLRWEKMRNGGLWTEWTNMDDVDVGRGVKGS